jgi:hypothetical protein
MIREVIEGSKGRQLVYVAPEGDVIIAVDWAQACTSIAQRACTKETL